MIALIAATKLFNSARVTQDTLETNDLVRSTETDVLGERLFPHGCEMPNNLVERQAAKSAI
jgi:hypothetical protein